MVGKLCLQRFRVKPLFNFTVNVRSIRLTVASPLILKGYSKKKRHLPSTTQRTSMHDFLSFCNDSGNNAGGSIPSSRPPRRVFCRFELPVRSRSLAADVATDKSCTNGDGSCVNRRLPHYVSHWTYRKARSSLGMQRGAHKISFWAWIYKVWVTVTLL
jgi:hypothetical protein